MFSTRHRTIIKYGVSQLYVVQFIGSLYLLYILFYREFNTSVDIELHKWADSLQLATLCTNVRKNLVILCILLHKGVYLILVQSFI